MTASTANPSTSVPWYLVLLQGILSILIGILLVTTPGIATIVIVRLLGWYWLIKGIFSLTAVFNPEAKAHRGWLIFNSIVGIIAGFAVLDHPLISAIFVPTVLVIFIGIAGLLIGVNDLLAAFRGAGWGMALLGILSIVFGGVILANAVIGERLLPYVIGVTELVGGLIAIFIAFKLRAVFKR